MCYKKKYNSKLSGETLKRGRMVWKQEREAKKTTNPPRGLSSKGLGEEKNLSLVRTAGEISSSRGTEFSLTAR